MANYGQRLSYVSGDLLDTKFSLSDSQWQTLEEIYSKSFSLDAKAELTQFCRYYLNDTDAENRAASESDVKNKAKDLSKKLQPFIDWQYRPHESDDANVEFADRLRTFLEQRSISLEQDELHFNAVMPEAVETWLSANPARFIPTNRVMMEYAILLGAGLDLISQGKPITPWQAEQTGFVVGSAWQRFLCECKHWAKTNRLSHGPYNAKGEVGSLPTMIYQLNGMFPIELKYHQVNSLEAMATQLKRSTKA